MSGELINVAFNKLVKTVEKEFKDNKYEHIRFLKVKSDIFEKKCMSRYKFIGSSTDIIDVPDKKIEFEIKDIDFLEGVLLTLLNKKNVKCVKLMIFQGEECKKEIIGSSSQPFISIYKFFDCPFPIFLFQQRGLKIKISIEYDNNYEITDNYCRVEYMLAREEIKEEFINKTKDNVDRFCEILED